MARSRAQTRPVTPPWGAPRSPRPKASLGESGPRPAGRAVPPANVRPPAEARRGGAALPGPTRRPAARCPPAHALDSVTSWQSPVATDVLLTDDGSSPHSPRWNVLPPQFPAKLPHWGPPPRRPLTPAPPSHGARSRRLRGRRVLCRPLRGPSEGTAASLSSPHAGVPGASRWPCRLSPLWRSAISPEPRTPAAGGPTRSAQPPPAAAGVAWPVPVPEALRPYRFLPRTLPQRA